jgi:hypothetical protein
MPSSWHSSPFSIEQQGSIEKKGAASGEAKSRRLSYNQRGEHKHQDIGNLISSSVGWTEASAPAAPVLDHLAAARAAQATRTSILSRAN